MWAPRKPPPKPEKSTRLSSFARGSIESNFQWRFIDLKTDFESYMSNFSGKNREHALGEAFEPVFFGGSLVELCFQLRVYPQRI